MGHYKFPLGRKGIFNPMAALAIYRINIESAGWPCNRMIALQPAQRSAPNPCLLRMINGVHGLAKPRRTPVTNLNEHEHGAIPHDQVDLADFISNVLRHPAQALCNQGVAGQTLCPGATALGGCSMRRWGRIRQ